jgi:hypothetical protein
MLGGRQKRLKLKRIIYVFWDSPNPDKSEDTRYAETHLRFEFSNV